LALSTAARRTQWFSEIYCSRDIEIIYVETNKLHQLGWATPAAAAVSPHRGARQSGGRRLRFVLIFELLFSHTNSYVLLLHTSTVHSLHYTYTYTIITRLLILLNIIIIVLHIHYRNDDRQTDRHMAHSTPTTLRRYPYIGTINIYIYIYV